MAFTLPAATTAAACMRNVVLFSALLGLLGSQSVAEAGPAKNSCSVAIVKVELTGHGQIHIAGHVQSSRIMTTTAVITAPYTSPAG